MAILGTNGVLDLSEPIPSPLVLSKQRLNISSSPYSITVASAQYNTGDHVVIASKTGVPFELNLPELDSPDGYSLYLGSKWKRTPARSNQGGTAGSNYMYYYLDSNGSPVGSTFDGSGFYAQASTNGVTTYQDAFINKDALDRVRFWSTEAAAHANSTQDANGNTLGTELVVQNIGSENMILARYDSSWASGVISDYLGAVETAANQVGAVSLPQPEQLLETVITLPQGMLDVAANENRTFDSQLHLTGWSLSLNNANLDTTAIGEAFGESVGSIARGSGSLQFVIEHEVQSGSLDSLSLLKAVIKLQSQAKAKAKFYLYKNRSVEDPRTDGSAYYECDIILTNCRLNARPKDLMAGVVDFVATSKVNLRLAT